MPEIHHAERLSSHEPIQGLLWTQSLCPSVSATKRGSLLCRFRSKNDGPFGLVALAGLLDVGLVDVTLDHPGYYYNGVSDPRLASFPSLCTNRHMDPPA